MKIFIIILKVFCFYLISAFSSSIFLVTWGNLSANLDDGVGYIIFSSVWAILVLTLFFRYILRKKRWKEYYLNVTLKNYKQKILIYVPFIFLNFLPFMFTKKDPTLLGTQFFYLIFGNFFMVAFWEEIAYRAASFKNLLPKGEKIAIIVPSLLFAAQHVPRPFSWEGYSLYMASTFIIGVNFAMILLIDRTIVFLIILHAANNILVFSREGRGLESFSLDGLYESRYFLAYFFVWNLCYTVYLWNIYKKQKSKNKMENFCIARAEEIDT